MKETAKVLNIPKKRQRPPFFPMTGNPENGDYLDWYRELRDGEVLVLQKRDKKPT